MSHSIGISDSYYRITEEELLQDYLKAVEFLTINNEEKLRTEVKKLESHVSNIRTVEFQLEVKSNEMQQMKDKHEQEMRAMRKEMNQQFNQIMLLIQQNPLLAQMKSEALMKKIHESDQF